MLSLVLSAAAPASASPLKMDTSALDHFIQSSMLDWKVPGVSVAIVRDQSVLYMKGFGVRDIRSSQPVTPDTVFDIGSCAKAFTTAAIGILADEGKMQWDAKVSTYVPYFHLKDPVADQYATIRDILTHRTGLPGADLMWAGSNIPTEVLIRRLAFLDPESEFRTQFEYQNMMYATAGEALLHVTGMQWREVLRQRIFRPLGMDETVASVAEAQQAPDHATPHTKSPDGSIKAVSWYDPDNVQGAGGVVSSARDMTKWLMLQLNDGVYDGKRLISSASMREMHTPQMVIAPDSEIPTVFFPDSTQISYGLGWFVQEYRGHQLILHAGDIRGFATMVVLIPEIHAGFFAVINLGSTYRQVLSYQITDWLLHLPDAAWSAHYKKFEADAKAKQQAADARLALPDHPDTHPSRGLAAYTGAYANPVYGDAEVALQDGKLTLHFHAITSSLQPLEYDTFLVDFQGKKRLTFLPDDDGNIGEFTVASIPFKHQR